MECRTDFEIDMNKTKRNNLENGLSLLQKVECFASFMLLFDTLYSRNQINLSSVIFFLHLHFFPLIYCLYLSP